jgi:hypothetical protein
MNTDGNYHSKAMLAVPIMLGRFFEKKGRTNPVGYRIKGPLEGIGNAGGTNNQGFN